MFENLDHQIVTNGDGAIITRTNNSTLKWPVNFYEKLNIDLVDKPPYSISGQILDTNGNKPITAKVTGKDGNVPSEDIWKILTIPENFSNMPYAVTKTAIPGILEIHFKPFTSNEEVKFLGLIPIPYKIIIEAIKYDENPSIKFSVEYAIGTSAKGKGSFKENYQFEDKRSLLDKLVYLFCSWLFWLAVVLFGYINGVKKYMPAINKRPVIKQNKTGLSLDNGEYTYHASYQKSPLNWLPYVSSRGKIKLPSIKGVPSVMLLKAVGDTRVRILNSTPFKTKKGSSFTISFGSSKTNGKNLEFSITNQIVITNTSEDEKVTYKITLCEQQKGRGSRRIR